MAKFLVIDVETTMRGTNSLVSSPLNTSNRLIAVGYTTFNTIDDDLTYAPTTYYLYIHESNRTKYESEIKKVIDDCDVLIGHNLQFDLQWLYHTGYLSTDKLKALTLWDTAIGEYTLSGHINKFPTLECAAQRFSLGNKEQLVSELLKEKTPTEQIDSILLGKYLEQDIKLTANIFTHQVKRAIALNLFNTIQCSMEALVATVRMSLEGIEINVGYTESAITNLSDEMESLSNRNKAIDICSNHQVSCYLFGGVYRVDDEEQLLDDTGNPIYFKSGIKKGLPRTRRIRKDVHLPGVLDHIQYNTKQGKSGLYSVEDSVLKEIKQRGAFTDPIITDILRYRECQKLLGFYSKYKELTDQLACNILPVNINHTATVTGRTSSSNPNLQQVP